MDSNEASALVLQALVWTLQDDRRAQRLLALTGLEADTLRAHIGETATQRAVVDFLEGNEADLIACAEALEISPIKLLGAREALR